MQDEREDSLSPARRKKGRWRWRMKGRRQCRFVDSRVRIFPAFETPSGTWEMKVKTAAMVRSEVRSA